MKYCSRIQLCQFQAPQCQTGRHCSAQRGNIGGSWSSASFRALRALPSLPWKLYFFAVLMGWGGERTLVCLFIHLLCCEKRGPSLYEQNYHLPLAGTFYNAAPTPCCSAFSALPLLFVKFFWKKLTRLEFCSRPCVSSWAFSEVKTAGIIFSPSDRFKPVNPLVTLRHSSVLQSGNLPICACLRIPGCSPAILCPLAPPPSRAHSRVPLSAPPHHC